MSGNFFLKGASMCEYRLIIAIPQHVQEFLDLEKKYYRENFDAQFTSAARSSITLINFMQFNSAEQKIERKLQQLIALRAIFPIELNCYGFLPTHTIYIKIANRSAVQELVKDLRKHTTYLLRGDADHLPHFITQPYLVLAHNIKAPVFEKAIHAFEHRHFKANFLVPELLLLRREPGNKFYEKAASFILQEPTLQPTQTKLF